MAAHGTLGSGSGRRPSALGGLTAVRYGTVGRNGGAADVSTHTAITRVQSASAVTATAQASLAATFPNGGTATAGNTLLAAASSDATIPTPSGWTLNTPGVINFTGHYQWRKEAVGGETGLTIVPNGTVTAELYVEEMHGLTSSPLDVVASNDPNANASSIATGTTGTTAQADEYAFASFSWNDAPASGATLSTLTNPPDVAPRFVKLADLRGLDPTAMDTMLGVAGRMLGATGAVSSTAVLSGFAGRPTGIVATFKAGVGAPSASGSSAVTGHGEVASTGAKAVAGASAVSGRGGCVSSGFKGTQAASTVTGAGQVVSVGQRAASAGSVVSASGHAASVGTKASAGSSSVSAEGHIVSVGGSSPHGASVVTGTGSVASVGAKNGASASSVSGYAQVASTGVAGRQGSSVLSAVGRVQSVGTAARTGLSTVTGRGTISATWTTARFGSSSVTGTGTVASTAPAPIPEMLTLTVSGRFDGTLTVRRTASAKTLEVAHD